MQRLHFFHNRLIIVLSILLLLVLTLGLPGTQTQAAPTATDCAVQTDIPQAECETLVALYNSTDGPNWLNNTDWNVTNTPCSWYGITCSEGRVQKLQLSDNRLIGYIPDLSALTSLQEIKLNNRVYPWANQLSGPIPDLSALVNLQSLDLSYNQLSGPIPDLSTLTSLKDINLRHNQRRVASQRAALPAFPTSPLRTGRATFTASGSPH